MDLATLFDVILSQLKAAFDELAFTVPPEKTAKQFLTNFAKIVIFGRRRFRHGYDEYLTPRTDEDLG